MKTILVSFALIASTAFLRADLTVRESAYQHDGKTYRSAIVVPQTAKPLPGIFMVPNWMGMTDGSLEKAKMVAEMGYVVYMADVYGENLRPKNPSEAGKAAGSLRGDRPAMRAVGAAALKDFNDAITRQDLPVAKNQMGAIGFCFGGGMILEMARAGADIDALVSFHGDLVSPTLKDSSKIKGKVLVLNGADDPYVPPADVEQFMEVMKKTDVDWQLVEFGGAVHSFTNPEAKTPGKSIYDPRTSARAFAYMRLLFDETFGKQ
ncbi:dienelactone hydrolase family protein [Rubellicoccus peritrichatus]|uniref:Dienelactone hydrolase family protein n=1 Tax=Rubellicoccus peritrichatus TaxID=3080537 RepID=A0AAQ3LFS4_9BACT|nr:dienelactone hydrolase family protein [Puniceicoccus sp. CR14]WOO42988.1 dienelactone hydrolase family protein [Puniceicoccus sp. CR14]